MSGSTQSYSRGYSTYILVLLTLLYFFYLLDRMAIVVTQELIKEEFRLSDTQIGLIVGTFYGVSFAIAGLPLGRLADRVNRKRLLAVMLAIWSGLTAMCGLSASWWHLLLARAGIGAAEAGGAPASLSILSDIFPPEKRATVTSIFFSGTMIGMIVSFFAGGLIAQAYGWRAVFFIYGLPGLLLAAIILFTLREPMRAKPADVGDKPRTDLLRTAGALLGHKVVGKVYLGVIFYCLATASVGTWTIAFLMRVHDLNVAEAGFLVAVGKGVAGFVGGISLGMVSDRVNRIHPGGSMYVVAVSAAINFVAALVMLNAESLEVMIVGMLVFGFTMNAYPGPSTEVIARAGPSGDRATSFAMFTLLANLAGTGFGPVLVGVLSDLGPGSENLVFAMQSVMFAQLLAIVAYVWAARTLGAGRKTKSEING